MTLNEYSLDKPDILEKLYALNYDFVADGIYYKINHDGISVTVTYKCTYGTYSGDIIIPDSVVHDHRTYSVTSIGDRAFYICKGLTSVVIPESISSIGDKAFFHCQRLFSISIPESVAEIGCLAFYNCINLTEVAFNACMVQGPAFNSDAWFLGCSGITKLTIGDSVRHIPQYLCYNRTNLKSVVIPDSVTSIGDYAFACCSGLASITIPNSVTSIGYAAFCGCALLTLIIGAGVKQIGFNQTKPVKTIWLTEYPPAGSTNLSGMVNYVINDKNKLLDNTRVYRFLNYLFEADGVIYVPTDPYQKTCDAISCTYDERIKHCSVAGPVICRGLKLNIINVNDYCFHSNQYLQSVTLMAEAKIGEYALQNCRNLQMAIIGNDVKEIESKCFEGCGNLESISLGNNVISIGNMAFENCCSLKHVELNSKLKAIGKNAFLNCRDITKITSHSLVPPSCDGNPFGDINKWECCLSVPNSAFNDYKAANYWNEFFLLDKLLL